MTGAGRRTLVAAGVLFAAAVVFVAARFDVSTDILAFFPAGEQRELAALSREIAASELSRTMIVTVQAESLERAVEAGRVFQSTLHDQPGVPDLLAFVEGGPPVGIEEALWGIYHPRLLGFVARTPAEAAERTSAAALDAAAQGLVRQLRGPTSTLVARLAPSDPLLVLPGLFERLEGTRGVGMTVYDGRFVAADANASVILLGTKDSAFAADRQVPVLQAIDAAAAAVRSQFGADIVIESSGINRFAVRAERTIKADIRLVSILSMVTVTALLLLLYRSPRLVGVALVPVGTGVVAAAAVILAVYGRIHGVTLAFGASLIGVSIDYVIHLYSHHALHPGDPRDSVRAISRALGTAAATTIVGFVALAFSRFPGLREVALFSVTGLTVALATTVWVVPLLIPARTPSAPVRDLVATRLTRGVRWLRARRRAVAAAYGVVAIGAAVGLTGVHWNDDLSGMAKLDAELVAEDERVRTRVTSFDQARFVVALGDTDEAALQVNDAVATALVEAVAAGDLGSFRGVGDLLPSAATQRAVAETLTSDPALDARLRAAFTAAGFRADAFDAFLDSVQAGVPEPVTWDALTASPVGPLVRPFRVMIDGRVGYVTFVESVSAPDALAARLEPSGAVFVDQTRIMREANRGYQRGTARALGLGGLAVLLLLVLRYRDARRVFAAFAPSVLAAGTTVAVLALVGVGVDLVGLTALLMVVSMGVDYGVFLVDAADEPTSATPAALLSVVAACATTVLGFGSLAISTHPVLHTIGLTAAVGVCSAMLLAPAALVFVRPVEER